jgi:hypothetical protein
MLASGLLRLAPSFAGSFQHRIFSRLVSSSGLSTKARLVLNHSTFVDGLKPCLVKLTSVPMLATIVPGRISTRSVRRDASRKLMLRFSTADSGTSATSAAATVSSYGGGGKGGGRGTASFKLMASRGTQIQEVFIVLRHEHKLLDKNTIAQAMQLVLGHKAVVVVADKEKKDDRQQGGEDDGLSEWGL